MSGDVCPACEKPADKYDRQVARWMDLHHITVETNGDGVVSAGDGPVKEAPGDWRGRYYHRITLRQNGGKPATFEYWSNNESVWKHRTKPQLGDIGGHARDFLEMAINYETPEDLADEYPGMKLSVAKSFLDSGKALREALGPDAKNDLLQMEF